MKPPQALTTTYPARLALYSTALLGPAAGATLPAADSNSRRTKRGTQAVNYAEVELDDDGGTDTPPNADGSSGAAFARPQAPFYPPGRVVNRHLYGQHRSEAQLNGAGSLPTVLIPIRLDLDLPTGRLHDTFLWNLHETLITPETFAQTMVVDMDLPPHTVGTIAAAIRDQLAEYAPVAQIPLSASSGEMRAVCSLTVNLDDVVYADRFEWDLTSSLPPEQFARLVAAELGLRSEFVPAIAAGIYEFGLQRKKDLYDSGLPELDNAAARQDGVDAGWRLEMEGLGVEWEPRVEVLTRDEIEKREIDREREVRRLRRETARFGTTGTPGGPGLELEELGRGGRGRVRKRQRSVSPTPVDGEWERRGWNCRWCGIAGLVTWGAGDGPDGPKTLCWNCSSMWKEKGLQEWAKGLHIYPHQQQQQQQSQHPMQQHFR